MILGQGSKVFIVHRRLFEEDHQRFFVGLVDAYEAGITKVTGHSWVRDPFVAHPVKKEGARTKIFSLSSGTLLVYELPDTVDMRLLSFESDEQGRLMLCDGHGFRLDISEGNHMRKKT